MVKEVNTDDSLKKGSLVKFLIFVLILFTTPLFTLFIHLLLHIENEICDTEQCIKTAAIILQNIDQSAGPCENFYHFACGKIFENRLVHESATIELNTMIMEPIDRRDSRAFIMQKLFHQYCTNLEMIENDQDRTIQEVLRKLGDWPILRGSNWNRSNFSWIDFMIRARAMGLKYDWFLQFEIDDESNHSLKIKIPDSPKSMNKNRQFYYGQLMTDVAVLMGAPKNIVHYETAKTVEFEDDLSNLIQIHRNTSNVKFIKMRIEDIQKQCSFINWLELIYHITGISFSGDVIIIFDVFNYLNDLNKLLLGTPKRIQLDFMIWKLLEKFWPYLSTKIRDRFEKYNQDMFREKLIYNREKYCLHESIKKFPLVVDLEYVRRHIVSEEKQNLIHEIIHNIKKEFIKNIKNVSWLDVSRKTSVINRILNITLTIGGTHDMFNIKEFRKYLNIQQFSFQTRNIISMINERENKFYNDYFGLLNNRTVNSNMTNMEENDNFIAIPVTILQNRYFNSQQPNYLNYATLGTFIAHKLFETTYKFSDNYIYWWSSPNFNSIVKCLLQQNTNMQLYDIKANFVNFVETEIAYKAYQQSLKSSELILPGLNYTPNQLFWIQNTIYLCNKNNDHTDINIQIMNSLINSETFSIDFQCSNGSILNPVIKCRIL